MPNRMFGAKGSSLPFEPHLLADAVMEPPLTDCTNCVNSSENAMCNCQVLNFKAELIDKIPRLC